MWLRKSEGSREGRIQRDELLKRWEREGQRERNMRKKDNKIKK
jgi:hypothetical protein